MLTQPRPRDGPKYPPPKLTTYSKARYTTSQDLTPHRPHPAPYCGAREMFLWTSAYSSFRRDIDKYRSSIAIHDQLIFLI